MVPYPGVIFDLKGPVRAVKYGSIPVQAGFSRVVYAKIVFFVKIVFHSVGPLFFCWFFAGSGDYPDRLVYRLSVYLAASASWLCVYSRIRKQRVILLILFFDKKLEQFFNVLNPIIPVKSPATIQFLPVTYPGDGIAIHLP